jgi:esterase/lipase superfamily enzyme
VLSRFIPIARVAAAAAVALSVAGCLGANGPLSDFSEATSTGALTKSPVLLLATTRNPAADPQAAPWFSGTRSKGLGFAEVRLTAPDRSLTGRVASVVSGDWSIASVGPFRTSGAAQAFATAAMGRDVLLYVHGYRESFQSAAISAAQLSDQIGFRGASGLFSWPSGGGTLAYGYDRESALWSRDGLEDLLKALSTSQSGGRVHVVAHSMGTLLTLETLRSLRTSGGDAAMAKIGSVVLAAPDIDIDLFASGLERLGPDARKITVISSTTDRALAVSSRIAGGIVRAGAADRDRLEALGVRVADASDYGSGLINHDLFLTSRDVQQVVKRAIERAD